MGSHVCSCLTPCLLPPSPPAFYFPHLLPSSLFTFSFSSGAGHLIHSECVCQEVWLSLFPVLVQALPRPNKRLIWHLLRRRQHLHLGPEPIYPARSGAWVPDVTNKYINLKLLPLRTWSQVTLGSHQICFCSHHPHPHSCTFQRAYFLANYVSPK